MRSPKLSLATAAILGCGTVGIATGVAHAAGSTLFVNGAAGCSDDTTDSSVQAYCTVHAAAAVVQPGQTVQIAAGTYRETVVVTAQGTADAPITITAAPGASVLLVQGSAADAADIVDFEHAAYVTLTGVRTVGVVSTAGVVVNASSHISLVGDTFDAGHALGLGITGSDSTFVARDVFQPELSDGVAVGAGSTATVVTDSDVQANQHGVLVDGAAGTSITGITAEGACAAGVEVSGGATDTTIENSVLGNRHPEYLSTQCPSTDVNTGDLSVAADSIAGTHADFDLLDPVTSGSAVYRWGAQTFATAADFHTATGQGAQDIVADPLLGYYGDQPQEGSPAIDSADSAAVGEQDADLLGASRVTDPTTRQLGAGPRSFDDRGAYEFQDPFRLSGPLQVAQDGTSFTATLTAQTSGWQSAAGYTFDFGDGHPVTQDSPTITHTFPVAGTAGQQSFLVTVTATEAVTGTRVSGQLYVFLQYSRPAVGLTASAVKSADGTSYSLVADASGTTAGTEPIASYTFYVSKISNPDIFPYSQTFTQTSPVLTLPAMVEGLYDVQVVATDTLGVTASQEIQQAAVPIRPQGAVTVHRISGSDRYQTGVHVSQQMWADAAGDKSGRRTAGAVVLATGQGYADAVAGVPLAAKVNGPLLLTEPGALTAETADEITRILPAHQGRTVYVLGGTTAIAPAVEDRLRALGYTVVRFGGSDRFATALEIAKQEFPDATTAYVATGLDYADALAAGPLAATKGAPVLLSNGTALDTASAAYVRARPGTPTAVGGGADQALTGAGIGHAGLVGVNRFETAAKVALAFPQGDSVTSVGFATGLNYADALTGGAMMAVLGQPLLLTDPSELSGQDDVVSLWWKLNDVSVFGGTAAVSDTVFAEIVQESRGRAI